MPNYGFEAVDTAGKPVMGVQIVHDPARCAAMGITCTDARKSTTTGSGSLATMSLTSAVQHYFRATKAGMTPVETNNYTTGMNQARYIEFLMR